MKEKEFNGAEQTVHSEGSRRMSLKEYGKSINMQSYTMVILLIVIGIFLIVTTKGTFIQPRNLSNLLRQMSITGFLTIGMMLIIVHGEIDLSIGSVMLFCSTVAAWLHVYQHMGVGMTILLTLAVGTAIGAWNGFWVAKMAVPSFIATMGSQLVFKGLSLAISNGAIMGPFSETYLILGQSYVPKTMGLILGAACSAAAVLVILSGVRSKKKFSLDLEPASITIGKMVILVALILGLVLIFNAHSGIAAPTLLLFLFALIFTLATTKTKFGRNLYAIGSNREAAEYSGINVRMESFKAYLLMGLLSGMGAVVMTSRLNMATSTIGNMAEMDAISACVIGGVSMAGGLGSVPGALCGALLIAMLDNGMSLLNFDSFWQFVVKGIVLTIVVCYDISMRKKK